jgi:uncharacterized protein (TIGR00251 family)
VIAADGCGIVLRIHVQPGASRSRVAGVHGDALKVQLRARPIEGAANRELVRVLAAALAVRPGAVTLVAGARGRAKRVRVDGIDVATATARLGSFVDKAGGAD